MTLINLLGNGFIGREFSRRYEQDVVINPRDDYSPVLPKILYTISTTDNYNIFTDPHKDVDTNLTVLIKTLENARKRFGNAFEFNFISSWFVYGKVPIPAGELSACNPTGFYSITKRTAEQLLISYCGAFEIPYRILRLSNIIGVSDTKVSEKRNALQYMIRELALGKAVTLYKGKLLRDILDVRDAVSAIRLVTQKGFIGEIYNIGSGIGYSIRDLVMLAQSQLGTGSIKTIPVPSFHRRVQTENFVMDIKKLESLGFVRTYNPIQTVHEIADFYKEKK